MELNVHDVSGVEVRGVRHFPAEKTTGGKEFWVRELVVRSTSEGEITLKLFTGVAGALALPGEADEEARVARRAAESMYGPHDGMPCCEGCEGCL